MKVLSGGRGAGRRRSFNSGLKNIGFHSYDVREGWAGGKGRKETRCKEERCTRRRQGAAPREQVGKITVPKMGKKGSGNTGGEKLIWSEHRGAS